MLKRQANPRDDTADRQAGFSVVELLITVLILTVVLFAIYSMYQTNMSTATWGNKKAELQQNARVALDMMQRELRMAGYDPSNTGKPAIKPDSTDTFSATNLSFIADIDGDDKTEKVKYTFHDQNDANPPLRNTITRSLWRWNGTGWDSVSVDEVVADGVSSVALTYCDNSNPLVCNPPTTTLAPASVKKITVSITASGQAGSKTQTFTFASDVRLRNL